VRLDGDLLPFSPCSPTHVSDRCMLANACPRKTAELTVSSKQTRSSFSRFIPADPSEYASPASGLRRATWHYSVVRAACRRRSSPRSLHCFSLLQSKWRCSVHPSHRAHSAVSCGSRARPAAIAVGWSLGSSRSPWRVGQFDGAGSPV
jgi:hypothetical protein